MWKRYQLMHAQPGAPATPAGGAPPAAPAAPAVAAAPASGTATPPATPPAGTGTAPATPAGADDWRKAYAAHVGDPKKAERLGRYTTANDAFDALLSVQNKIAAGELRTAYPKDATPEQLAKWRADNEIPAAPEEYEKRLVDVEIDPEDKEVFAGLFKVAHDKAIHPAMVAEVIKWHQAEREAYTEKMHEQDRVLMQQAEDKLRVEWGQDYRYNINAMRAILDMAPEAVREELTTGRLGNGQPLLAHPDVQRWLVGLARQINPVTTLVPAAGANIGRAIDDEIGTIEKTMRENRKAYNDNPQMQKRYMELLDARARIGQK